MTKRSKIILFSFITFCNFLIILFSLEFFLFKSQKNFKKINENKFQAFLDAKQKISNIKPYANSMYTLNHDLNFPKLFSPSTFFKSDIFICNENGYYAIIKTDRYGFYNNDEIYNDDFDEVFLGDSFTAGSCVNIDDNIISNYQKNFMNKKIVNLGTPGGSLPLLELIKLKEYVFVLENFKQPKKIYWLYYEGNDLRELNNFYKNYKNENIFKYIYDETYSQNLIRFDDDRNKELQKSYNYLLSLIENDDKNKNFHKYKFYHFLTFAKIRSLIKDTWVSERQNIDTNTLDLFEDIVKLSKKIIDKNGAELIFVYLPTIERYKKFKAYNYKINGSSILDVKLKNDEIIKILNKLDIKILNAKNDIFGNHYDPLSLFPQRIHHHYNEEGYRVIANFISKKIEN